MKIDIFGEFFGIVLIVAAILAAIKPKKPGRD